MNRIIVVGGFAESERSLRPVVEAACSLNLAQDGAVFRLLDVMDNPDPLKSACEGGTIYTHAAGIMAVTDECRPTAVEAFNGPEPMKVRRLIRATFTKDLRPETFAGNAAEFLTHPFAYSKSLGSIAAFSTFERLLEMTENRGDNEDAYTRLRLISMLGDKFGFRSPRDGHDVLAAVAKGIELLEMAGRYDDLLVEPERVLSLVNNLKQ